MPSLSSLSDFVNLNIGAFVKGRWDYVGLAQLYPKYEVIGQLVPRKVNQENSEITILYQTRSESTGRPAKPGEPISLTSTKGTLTRKIKMVKYLDYKSWTLDQNSLLGKADEHLIKQIQKDLVEFDLHWWEDLENMMLRMADNVTPADDEYLFGFPAWVTNDSNIAADTFQLYGGDDPYVAGRPGSIPVATYPGYTNPVAKFSTVSDDNFFDFLEEFLSRRKVMGVVPNPGLLPDTPNDVLYTQLPLHKAVQRYMQASNENIGVDAGRYRGNPMYKTVPIVNWDALGHPDSPVAPSTCEAYLIDWNSFEYSVHPEYDRKIEGPTDVPLVPGGKYITSEVWHQLSCSRPDRNLKMVSDTANLQP